MIKCTWCKYLFEEDANGLTEKTFHELLHEPEFMKDHCHICNTPIPIGHEYCMKHRKIQLPTEGKNMKIHFTMAKNEFSKKDIKVIQKNAEGRNIYEIDVHCATIIEDEKNGVPEN